MAPPLNSPTSPTSPKSPTIQGFDNLNLRVLAQSTKKSFERLAPYTRIQNPQGPEAQAADVNSLAERFRQRMVVMISAMDTSISSIEALYHLSKEAGTLCDTVPLPLASDEAAKKGKDNAQNASGGMDEEKTTTPKVLSRAASLLQLGRASNSSKSSQEQRQQVRRAKADELVKDACKKASEAAQTFRQVDQELYKLAAATKDMPAEATVQIPVDPAASKLITRSIRDLGNDLVSNLSALSAFSGHLSDLSNWCEWVQNGVASSDFEGGSALLPCEVDTIARRKNLNSQWTKVLSDTILYHNMISDLLAQYPDLLPHSAESWKNVTEGRENEKTVNPQKGKKSFMQKVIRTARTVRSLCCCYC